MNIRIMEGTANPFQTSGITKIQDFYWLNFEELFDEVAMKKKWIKKEDLEYVIKNRDVEFSKKSTKWFELRKWVQWSERFMKLKDFYWITMDDTQDIEKLRNKWVPSEDILFITWIDIEKKEEAVTGDLNELFEKHKELFWKYPPKNIKLETLMKKIWAKKN